LKKKIRVIALLKAILLEIISQGTRYNQSIVIGLAFVGALKLSLFITFLINDEIKVLFEIKKLII